MTLQEQIDKLASDLQILTDFVSNYGQCFNDDEIVVGIGTYRKPHFTCRDAALAGEVFGKDGWTRQQSWQVTCFNWTREIDSVAVTIQDAETIPLPKTGDPISPKQFPLLLKEI